MAKEKKLIEADFSQLMLEITGTRESERVVGCRDIDQEEALAIRLVGGKDEVVLDVRGVYNPQAPAQLTIDMGENDAMLMRRDSDSVTLRLNDYALDALTVESSRGTYDNPSPVVYIKDAEGNVLAELRGVEKLVLQDAGSQQRTFSSENESLSSRSMGWRVANKKMVEQPADDSDAAVAIMPPVCPKLEDGAAAICRA